MKIRGRSTNPYLSDNRTLVTSLLQRTFKIHGQAQMQTE